MYNFIIKLKSYLCRYTCIAMCISLFLCMFFLSGCEVKADIISLDSKMEANKTAENDIRLSNTSAKNNSEPISKSINNFIEDKIKSFSNDGIEVSALIIDNSSGRKIVDYGDINDMYEPSTTFKAIIAAIFIDYYGLNLDMPMDSSPYKLGDKTVRSWYNEDAKKTDLSFQEGFTVLNNPIFFRIYDKIEDKNDFMGLIKMWGFDVEENDNHLFLIGRDMNTNLSDMALAYAAFANGGKLFLHTEGELSEYKQVLSSETASKIKDLLYNTINNNIWFEKNSSYDMCGLFATNVNESNQLNITFTGFAPSEDPKVTLAVNIKVPQGKMMTAKEIAPFIVSILEYCTENYDTPSNMVTLSHASKYISEIKDLSILDNPELIIYFGRPTCFKCVKIEPLLLNALDKNRSEILYFNTDAWRNSEQFDDIIKKYNVTSVPTIIKIKDGKTNESLEFDNIDESGDINNYETKISNKLNDFLSSIT